MRPEDAVGLQERRSDLAVAEFQNWSVPFPIERAQETVAACMATDGPTSDEWWMVAIADSGTGQVFGDLALLLSNEGRSAEVGYTLASQYWGNGYATEALRALVSYLFETLGVTRVAGMLHPDNRASAMVLERTGFLFEGRTRLSYWVGDENSDDLIYGLTRPDWEAWRDRIRSYPTEVHLVEMSHANRQDVLDLRTHKSQEAFVAPMAKSLSQAMIPPVDDGPPVVPWLRAAEADGAIVGFVMLDLSHPTGPFLWRLLIDRMHQRRGIASRVLAMVDDELRAMGETTVYTSWIEGRGSPRQFYLGRGFELTGDVVDGETVAHKIV